MFSNKQMGKLVKKIIFAKLGFGGKFKFSASSPT
jgi:hypothetical protein